MIRLGVAIAGAALLAGCGQGKSANAPRAGLPSDWRTVATQPDRERLRDWRDAFVAGLDQVRAAGKTGELIPATLFDPDRAIAGAAPPPGDYRCRAFKLGAQGSSKTAFAVTPFSQCRIESEGDVLSISKIGGLQRPVGLIFRDNDTRATFLGTMVYGDERAAMLYGQDKLRDMAGVVERVDDGRWRIILPYPAFESVVEVVEILPAE